MQVRIFQKQAAVNQSGPGAALWHLGAMPDLDKRFYEDLMARYAGRDCYNSVKLTFASLEQAIEFAKSEDLEFEVIKPKYRSIKGKSYAANFQ